MLGRRENLLIGADRQGSAFRQLPRMLTAVFAAFLVTALGQFNLTDGSGVRVASASDSIPGKADNEVQEVAAADAPRQLELGVLLEPFSLAYVPRDAKVLAGARMSALKDSQALKFLNEFLAKDQKVEKEIGIPLERVEQIVVVYFEDGEGSAAVIFHLAGEDDAAMMLKAGGPDPEEDVYAGQAYLRRKANGGKPNCVFADSKIVVVAQDEQHLRRLINAGRKGASQAKWAQVWNAAIGNDAVALVNVRKLRAAQSLQGPFNLAQLFLVFPAELAPLLEVSTAVISVKAGDEIHATVRLTGTGSADLKKIYDATRGWIDLMQAYLSNERVEASGKKPAQAATELELIERIDGLLDTVEFRMNETFVEASIVVTQDDAKSIVENAIASE